MARVLFAVSLDEDQVQGLLDHLAMYKGVIIGKYNPHPDEMEKDFPEIDEDHNLNGCDPMTLLEMDLAYGEIDTEFD